MTIKISFIHIIDILSISTAFMLGLLFLTSKSRKNKANVFLGIFLWLLSCEVLSSFLDGQSINIPILFSLSALTLPFLFLYVIKTLNDKIKPIYSLFLIPFVLELLNISPFSFIQYGFSLFILFYTLNILQQHEKKLGDYYSDIENKTLSWIKTIIYIYLFFNAFWIAEDLIGLQFEFITAYFAITSAILTLVMIYWIGHNGFSQPEIFNLSISVSKAQEPVNNIEKEPVKEKTEPSNKQNEEQDADIFHQLTQKIREDKLFLQKDITIRNLSRQLKINEKVFSKLINTHTQKNFYHYVNQFRVEEFKQLLQTEKASHLSLLGLSEEAGFSSKSTFYSAFKAAEGITPKQYQDQLNKSE